MKKQMIKIIKKEELDNFATEISKKISAPFFIGLEGEMGAGKTTFTQSLVNKIFQKEEIVNSPTFSIINIYEHKDIKIIHTDLFRLETYDDLIFSGIEEYLFDNNAIVITEWYSKIDFKIPKPNLLIKIEIISENERQFTINSSDILF
jgi:tRNA threonylcarbamoyladenosine biosynthesis protein TsaE